MADDRCCCGIFHVKHGTWAVGIVTLILSVVGIIQAIAYLNRWGTQQTFGSTTFIVQLVLLIIWLIVTIILFYALLKNQANLILPHLIFTVVVFIWQVVSIILIIINGNTAILNIIFFVCVALIILYMLYVEYICYKWMKGSIA